MMKTGSMRLCLFAAIFAAGSSWSAEVPLNKALYDFEFTDVANTMVATNTQAIADSEFWDASWIQTDLGSTKARPPQFIDEAGDSLSDPGENFALMFPRPDDSDTVVTSVPFGPVIEDGGQYLFTFDWNRKSTSSKTYVRFRVFSSSSTINDTPLIDQDIEVNINTWSTTPAMIFDGTPAIAGQQVYIVFSNPAGSYAAGDIDRDAYIDNITMQSIVGGFSESARVLAFNVDDVKADFEYVADGVGLDLSLSAVLDGVASGGSTNESYGTFFDPVGAVASPEAYPWRAGGASTLVAELTITNTSSDNLKLDGLYFDVNRAAETAVRQIKFDYIGGDLGAAGTVYDITLDTTAALNIWKWCDLTLTTPGDVTSSPDLGFNAMSDVVLGANETATFRLTLQSSSDAATEPDQMLIDNIALIGDFFVEDVLVDWSNPGMFFGNEGTTLLNLGANTSVINGDLYLRNYTSVNPQFDRNVAGYYQAQDMYGLLQTGNQGAGAESRPFRYYKVSDGTPSTADLFLTVTPAGDALNGTSIFQSSLVYYKAEDFYDSIEAGEVIDSLEMNLLELKKDAGHVRFAVKSDGQWYASFVKATEAGVFSMLFPSAESSWGAFTPVASESTTMMSDAEIAFDTAGTSLTNVEAVGFFVEISGGGSEANLSFKYDAFMATAGLAPTDFPDSSVLAYNVDGVKTDFEYVKSGIDFGLTIVKAGNNPDTTLGSLDGSLGSFYDPNSADTNSAARPWAGRGTAEFVAEMTIGNIRPNSNLELDGFYFDLYRHQVASIAARQIELEYISGDLVGVSSGLVYRVIVETNEFIVTESETNVVDGVTNIVDIIPWADFDWTFAAEGTTPSAGPLTFNALGDTSLAFGESATFRLTIKSSTDPDSEANQTRLDNIAFLGNLSGIGYDSWIKGFGLATNDYGRSLDPDEDGFDNLSEYGLNGDPNDIGNTGTSPTYGTSSGGVFIYVHPKRADFGNGLVYHLELTDDLVFTPWINSGYTVMGTDVTGGILDFVTNEVSTATKDEQFIRLIIEEL